MQRTEQRDLRRRGRVGGPIKAGDQSMQMSYKHKRGSRQSTVYE